MAVHEHGLRIGITDYSDTAGAFKLIEFVLKLAPEIIVFKVMDAPEETLFKAVSGHTGAACSQM
jgi:hypothetical protein